MTLAEENYIAYADSITLLKVASFGVYTILNMLIYEKMNDIVILKAINFYGKNVQFIFLNQAMIIGAASGVLGSGIGYFLSLIINGTPFETEALPLFPPNLFTSNPGITSSGFYLQWSQFFFEGYLPSLKARKIDPVEIIRGQ
jgi:lipoprotein-releasing system permease protein